VQTDDQDPSGDEVFSFRKGDFVSAFADQYRYSTLGALVKGIIHNLNGNLHILSIHMELLQKMLLAKGDGLDPPIHKRMDVCLGHVDRLKGVIDLLAQKATRDEQDAPELVHLNELLEEEFSLLHHNLFLKHQVKVQKEFVPGIPAIEGIYIELSQGLGNLIQNAIEAMETAQTRELTVATGSEGDRVWLTIRDTGCGIAPEVSPHLFQPFFTTKGGRHNGLGLFIARELLAPYGGSFQYSSTPSGTLFRISFPVGAGGAAGRKITGTALNREGASAVPSASPERRG
jgi:signal transduction histidine kinase